MREIKFRAWFDGKMHGVTKNDWFSIRSDGVTSIFSNKNDSEAILMQFIGRKDRQGQEIYEGDIVAVYDWGIATKDRVIEIGKVEWDDEECGWSIISVKDGHTIVDDRYDLFLQAGFDVVGNIYQDKGLMGGGTK